MKTSHKSSPWAFGSGELIKNQSKAKAFYVWHVKHCIIQQFLFLFDLLSFVLYICVFVFNLWSFLLYIFCFNSIIYHLYSISVSTNKGSFCERKVSVYWLSILCHVQRAEELLSRRRLHQPRGQRHQKVDQCQRPRWKTDRHRQRAPSTWRETCIRGQH